MSQSTDDFIRALAEDLPPIQPMERLRETLSMALLASLPLSLVWLMTLGLRPELAGSASLPEFYLPIIAILALMAAGGLVAGVADAIPGRESTMMAGRWITALGGLAAIGSLGFINSHEMSHQAASSIQCVLGTAFLAVPSVALCARFVARGAGVLRRRAFFFACVGGMALSALVIHLSCPESNAMHLILGHALAPTIGSATALGAVLAILSVVSRRARTD